MLWRTVTPPDSFELALSRAAWGFEVGRRGRLVSRLTVRRSLLTLVGLLRGRRVFVDMVVGRRGAPRCRQPVGRRSRFDPCTPGWFGVGRPACGLFTVKCFGRLMVCLVCVGFVVLLPLVVSPNLVCAAGTSVSALASCVVVGPSAA